MAERKISYGTYTAMTVTNLHSLATDASAPFGGWQSDKIDNQTTTKAIDYEIMVEIAAVNTAPANDKAVYVYAAPCVTTDGGTTWKYSDNGGNSDLLDGAQGACDISEPNSMLLLGIIPYTVQNTVLNKTFFLSSSTGGSVPDGFQIVIRNSTGMTFAASANIVAYRAITETIA